MSTTPTKTAKAIEYPTRDGKPMGESDLHRARMFNVIDILTLFYENDPNVYVSGNLLLFYEKGNRRKHVSPDAFVVFGVEKRQRLNYLVWEEGVSPRVVIELTSRTTRNEDLKTKYELYRDVLKVREYYLFDPFGEYLNPVLQGHRLRAKAYQSIRPVEGRLPSLGLGIHLEADGDRLRFWNPQTSSYLPDTQTLADEAQQRAIEATRQAAEAARREEEAQRQAAEAARRAEEAQRQAAESARREEEAQRQATEARQCAEQSAADVERLQRLLRQHGISPDELT